MAARASSPQASDWSVPRTRSPDLAVLARVSGIGTAVPFELFVEFEVELSRLVWLVREQFVVVGCWQGRRVHRW